MKVKIEKNQTLIALDELPAGACVRHAVVVNDEIYMRLNNPVYDSFVMVRLNDGEMFTAEHLSGYHWEIVDTEVVVHGK